MEEVASNQGDEFQRISLRPLALSDKDNFMECVMDEKVMRFSTWEPNTSREEWTNFMKDKVISHPWYKAICLGDKPVGAVSVTENSGKNRCRGALGYFLGSKYWGKGIATQAVKMVAESIFKDWPHLDRLEALVDIENVGSQRVLAKVGFQREGVLRKYILLKGKSRDMVIFSLLSTGSQT